MASQQGSEVSRHQGGQQGSAGVGTSRGPRSAGVGLEGQSQQGSGAGKPRPADDTAQGWELDGWVPVESPGQWSVRRAALALTCQDSEQPYMPAVQGREPSGSPAKRYAVSSRQVCFSWAPVCRDCHSSGVRSCRRGSQPWHPPLAASVAVCPERPGVLPKVPCSPAGSASPAWGRRHPQLSTQVGLCAGHPGLT